MEFEKKSKELSEELQNIITNDAKTHVGKTKPGKGKVPESTPEVRKPINKRNKLRKNVSHNRKEFYACQEAIISINNFKEACRGVPKHW